jgi:cytochrome c
LEALMMMLKMTVGAAAVLALASCAAAGTSDRERSAGGEALPKDVLVFLKPAWYRHASLDSLAHWFQHFGWDHGFNVDTTDHPEIFNADDLGRYDVVVFVSTTDLGNALNEEERTSLVEWYRKGHGIVALHAAAVHHHTWDWWATLVGCDFNSDSVRSRARLVVDPEARDHPALGGRGPELWVEEEWLCYDRSVSGLPGVKVLMRLDESTYEPVRPKFETLGGKPMGGDHPAAWCRDFEGGRFFYSALGHDTRAIGTEFGRAHLLGGLRWAATAPKRPETGAAPAWAAPQPVRQAPRGRPILGAMVQGRGPRAR